MTTFVLNSETADETVESLLKRLNGGDVRICDESGQVLAYVKAPDREAAQMERRYQIAKEETLKELDLLDERASRTGGLTTEELCRRVGIPFRGQP
jgi:hypothetical protein